MMMLLMTSISLTYATATGNSVMSSTTKANYVASQKAHHVVLGSTSKRWPSQKIAMAGIQLPSIKSDCSGIDIFQGAMSFINAEELIAMLKNIGSAAKGFAFYLALETVSPQIASGIKHLSKAIQDMNALNIGSCEGAAALIGAVVPRHSKLHENTCKIMGGNSGKLTDFVAGRKGCNEGSSDRAGISNSTTNALKDVLQEACNVAWYVIKQNTAWNQQLQETLMSVTGTVITEPGRPFRILPPLALKGEFFDAFATGGTAEVYTCSGDTHKCLTVGTARRNFTMDTTHAAKVKELIASIENKIYTNTALDAEETSLVEQSRIPILKIINVMSTYHKGKAPISIQMYEDIIAHDLLTQHIKHMVSIIRQMASSVRSAQINEEPLKQYIEQLKVVEKKLQERDAEIHRKSDQILQLIQKIQLLEQSIYANMRVLAPGG